MQKERGAINFDFHVVALMTVAVTRPDLLNEYLTDGKAKDPHGRPLALHDATKWARLRSLGFPAELLAEVLYLFEVHDIQRALVTIQRLFSTMSAIELYCPDECPDDEWFAEYVPNTARLTQPLAPAGVQQG